MSKGLVWFIIIIFALAIISNNPEEQSIFSWFKNKASQPKVVEAKSMPSSSNNYVCNPSGNLESHHTLSINMNSGSAKISNIDGYDYVNLGGTYSMMPSLAEGNYYLYQNYDNFKKRNSLEVGDIIVFKKKDNSRIIHRIIKIENINGKKKFTTKGDNNLDADIPIYEKDILQVVMGVIYK